MFGYCVPAGRSRLLRSMGPARTRCAGLTASFSIQGVAVELGITSQTVFDYLARGDLAGYQLTKGQPWQIDLSEEQIDRLRVRLRRTKRSRKEASHGCPLPQAENL